MPVKVGYWGLRGLMEPIRYLLRYVDEEFEDVRYIKEDGSDWFSIKATMGLDFPNLPYMIDGDFKLTQSLAILRYLARKHKLDGKDARENATLGMLEQQTFDFRSGLSKMAYSDDFDAQSKVYLEALPDKIKPFSVFLGEKKFILGDSVSYVDFYLYEALDHHRLLKASCLDDFENLRNYLSRIESLPAIRKYLDSKEYKRWPIYAPFAKFGGKGEFPMFK